ncbi:hypothetical protein [Halarsenatibacter silvermanii]|uniref:hypothetical protein n=1 Tax=Halarsenatibacter silvermanii TaxID=321763 RepID=UPI00135648F9|nr:hypothetical protein [Halarsenatibacter silvermanii]
MLTYNEIASLMMKGGMFLAKMENYVENAAVVEELPAKAKLLFIASISSLLKA